MAGELALKGMNVLLMSYDDRFRVHQKLENSVLNQRASASYVPFQGMESKQLLFDLLNNAGGAGADFHGYVERTSASIIYALFYGFRLKDAQDPTLVSALALNDDFSEFVQVGAYLVDTFPFLNVLPGFLAPWKAKAESHWTRQRKLHVGNLRRGLEAPGWTFAKHLHQMVESEGIDMSTDELAFEFGTLVDAALDGTTETLIWFVLACITQNGKDGRDFIAEAREELDAVVGRERLPEIEDRAQMPYVSAIVEEILRWRPAGAGGVPHFTKTESTYEGYRIPAGSVVLANHWAITREEASFGPDADEFIPERWLDPHSKELRNLPVVGFGYGRRTCPGRHFARNVVWLAIARLLWAFDIRAGRSSDDSGEPVVIDPLACTDGLVMRPLPFRASFEPRGPWARDIIVRECDTHGEDVTTILDKIGEDLRAKQQQ